MDHTHFFAVRRTVFRVICFFALLSPAALSMPSFAHSATADAPQAATTRITSERMQYDAAGQKVIFEGKVHVIRPDFELWSEKLTVLLEKEGKQSGNGAKRPGNGSTSPALGMEAGKVERIIAERNVRMQHEDKVGTSGKATYIAADGKIIMEQNPVVTDGPNQIRGQVINYYTRENRSEVLGTVDVRFVTTDNKGEGGPQNLLSKPQDAAKPAQQNGLKLGTGGTKPK